VSAGRAPNDERPPDGPVSAAVPALAAALVVGVAATGSGLLLPGADLSGRQDGAVRVGALVVATLGLVALTTRAGGPARTPLQEVPATLLLAASLLAGVAMVAAPFSPVDVGPSGPDATTTTTEPPTTTTTRPSTTTTTAVDEQPERDLDPLVSVAEALALLGLLAVVIYAAVRLVDTRRITAWWRSALPGSTEVGRGTTIDVAAAEAGLESSLEAVTAGLDPRDAISEAYARLLAALEATGAGRRPAEAPHEHVDRVLAPLGIRSAPLHELAELFVFARFSQHPVTDHHRARAIAALGEALADLRAHQALQDSAPSGPAEAGRSRA